MVTVNVHLLPVLDDGVDHRALGVDIGGDVQHLVAAEVRGGAVQEEQGEALEVMVGGAAGDGEAGHPGEDPHDVLGVRPELCEQLDTRVEAPLTHDGEGRAEVVGAPVRVGPGLQQQPGALPVLVDQGDKQRGLGLGVQDINTGSGIEQHLETLLVTGYKTSDKMRVI